MKSLNYVIVEVDSAYNNEKKISGDLSIVVNSTIESVENINRIARVVSAPEFTILEPGDEIVIHHNICRKRNGVRGERVESNYWLEENRYFVPLDEIYMYRRGGDWICLDPFVFVSPVKYEGVKSTSLEIIDSSDAYKGMDSNTGTIEYLPPCLEEYGYQVGDKVAFTDWSQHEFEIDGKLLYKMKFNDLMGRF